MCTSPQGLTVSVDLHTHLLFQPQRLRSLHARRLEVGHLRQEPVRWRSTLWHASNSKACRLLVYQDHARTRNGPATLPTSLAPWTSPGPSQPTQIHLPDSTEQRLQTIGQPISLLPAACSSPRTGRTPLNTPLCRSLFAQHAQLCGQDAHTTTCPAPALCTTTHFYAQNAHYGTPSLPLTFRVASSALCAECCRLLFAQLAQLRMQDAHTSTCPVRAFCTATHFFARRMLLLTFRAACSAPRAGCARSLPAPQPWPLRRPNSRLLLAPQPLRESAPPVLPLGLRWHARRLH